MVNFDQYTQWHEKQQVAFGRNNAVTEAGSINSPYVKYYSCFYLNEIYLLRTI